MKKKKWSRPQPLLLRADSWPRFLSLCVNWRLTTVRSLVERKNLVVCIFTTSSRHNLNAGPDRAASHLIKPYLAEAGTKLFAGMSKPGYPHTARASAPHRVHRGSPSSMAPPGSLLRKKKSMGEDGYSCYSSRVHLHQICSSSSLGQKGPGVITFPTSHSCRNSAMSHQP